MTTFLATENNLIEVKEQSSSIELQRNFSLDIAKLSFESSYNVQAENGKINLEKYLEGFEELNRLLKMLGGAFGWVSKRLEGHFEILRQHRKGENASEYQNVQDMIAYEVKSNLIKPKARDSSTGARNLLRLHRALEYIIAFLKGVPDLGTDEKCCPLSQDAYKRTLMKHHPWVVQKAATLAMHMLPLKKGLLEKVSGKEFGSDEYKAAEEILPRGVKVMEEVYAKTEEIYKQHDLLTLP